MDPEMLCVITARGGSKRIPRKNVREFCGKPIIAYSIEAALGSGLFDDVMVSTDDDGIADVARSFGASVPFMRSAEASDDFATTRDVLVEVLGDYERLGRAYKKVCCIYPTAPFVSPEKLQDAYSLLGEGVDTVVAVTKFSFPPQRGMVREGGGLVWWQPENANARSQDLLPVYHDAGQFYFCRSDSIMHSPTLFGSNVRGFEVSELEVQDIDNPCDWEIAVAKYERMVSIK